MENRPRCVLVVPVMPSPTGSGLQQRGFRVLCLLAQQFETAVLVAGEETEALPCQLPGGMATSFTVLPVKTGMSLGKRVARWMPMLVMLRPAWAADWLEVDAEFASPFADGGTIALCVVLRLRMHQVAEVLRRRLAPQKTTLDLDDVESVTMASIGWFAMRRGRIWLGLNSFSKALQSFCLERMLPARYDRVYVANPEDMDVLRCVAGRAQVMYLPNRVPLPARDLPVPNLTATRTLLFLGTLGYFPNEDAVLWIVESIVPELRRRTQIPFRIRIAGRHASSRLQAKMHGVHEVKFLGEVPAVDTLYAAAPIALIPVRCGGGTKIKALEAAAYHSPIVATSHAMRGLGFEQGRHYLRGNTAEEIADCCAFLLQQPEHRQAMTRNAYERLISLSTADSDSFPF